MEYKHIVEARLVAGARAVGGRLTAAANALMRCKDSVALQSEVLRDDSVVLQSELLELVQLGKDVSVTVQDIRINEQVGFALICLACAILKRHQISKFASFLPAVAGQAILLSGPEGTQAYHQLIAKALAHHFEAKLLILNVIELVTSTAKREAKMVSKAKREAGVVSKVQDFSTPSSTSIGNDDKVCTSCTDASEEKRNKTPAETPGSPGDSWLLAGQRRTVAFEEDIFVDALFKVLATLSETSPVVVYFPDAENFFSEGTKMHSLFMTGMEKLRCSIMILGSRIKPMDDRIETKNMGVLFRYKYNVQPPENHPGSVHWKSQVQKAVKTIQAEDNRMRIIDILYENHIDCHDISTLEFSDTLVLSDCIIEEVVFSAFSHHLMNMEQPEYRDGMFLISAKSLTHALTLFETGKLDSSKVKVQDKKTAAEVPANRFEKDIQRELIPAGEIGVKFQDIGALENVKESLQELVMLPIRRPEFFNRGGLIKPCKGILLFGPPGTGKTMLAKAVATEAGASFINVSMSTITSKWFGEDEKYVRALFTLATKVAPTVIFVDEVDSMLGKRSSSGEHEALRILKNEFMARWDGLLTTGGKHVLVLAATNRPFDLDEAIIRRFERRIMVGLPDPENREKILRTILSNEEIGEDLNFKEVAAMTEGYSGSDLKNLCIAAAYRRLREHLSSEQKEEGELATLKIKESPKVLSTTIGESEIKNDKSGKTHEINESKKYSIGSPSSSVNTFRPLSIQDIKEAKKQVSGSFAIEGAGMQELKVWNDLYGEGASRQKQQLTYFL